MSMIAVDTLKFAKQLKQAGMPEEQAEALAEAQAALLDELAHGTLATREALEEASLSVRSEAATVRSELKEDIAVIRSEIATLRSELKEDFASVTTGVVSLRSELKEDFASVKAELRQELAAIIKWNVATMIAMTAIVLAALRLS